MAAAAGWSMDSAVAEPGDDPGRHYDRSRRPERGRNEVASAIRHALAGGAGTDSCYAPQEVAVTGCEQFEAIGDPLLRMIETTFGTPLADVWRQ